MFVYFELLLLSASIARHLLTKNNQLYPYNYKQRDKYCNSEIREHNVFSNANISRAIVLSIFTATSRT
jgi:hypothetical protein